MKVIIPVAGIGSKLRPQTHTQPKALFPVAGKPILGHIIDGMLKHGLTDFIFVIGYLGDKIETYVSENYPNIEAQFVIQMSKEGIGHAIWSARELINTEDELLIALGDTIFDTDIDIAIKCPQSCVGIKRVDDPRNFGVVEIDANGMVTKLIEKPKIPKSNLALVGIYKIKEAALLMELLGKIIDEDIRTLGQFQLTDALMLLIEQNIKISTFEVSNWYDCGNKDLLLATNAILLARIATNNKLCTLNNSILIPPVSIASGCIINDSIIGPNVSVGENTTIKSGILADCIIGSYSVLESVILNHSLVGNDAILKGLSQSLNIGDSTEISFGEA